LLVEEDLVEVEEILGVVAVVVVVDSELELDYQ
jgi:hypothetical protein